MKLAPAAAILGITAPFVSCGSFDWRYGLQALQHSQSAYCDPDSYLTRQYTGDLAGFTATYAIDDSKHDTHGYIGYSESEMAIYVTYRGSESIRNWLDNLQVTFTDYPYCDGCEVHEGFYEAEQSCISGVISEVERLQSLYPSYDVIVTGHSLGAALATLTSLDFVNAGVAHVRMFNFGCPRVGNDEFASYGSVAIPDVSRVTHHKDVVVHTPGSLFYTHLAGEWYEPDDTMTLNECTGYEDEECSFQWTKTNIDDHLYYLGVVMGESGCPEES